MILLESIIIGTYIEWEKEYNDSIDLNEIKLYFSGGNFVYADISIDEVDYQEWEHYTIILSASPQEITTFHKLNKK
ncbi:MAG: hypothetical protein ACI9XO_000887 [Paraglaciecola sp.]